MKVANFLLLYLLVCTFTLKMFVFLSTTKETLALTKSGVSINDVEIFWQILDFIARETLKNGCLFLKVKSKQVG